MWAVTDKTELGYLSYEAIFNFNVLLKNEVGKSNSKRRSDIKRCFCRVALRLARSDDGVDQFAACGLFSGGGAAALVWRKGHLPTPTR